MHPNIKKCVEIRKIERRDTLFLGRVSRLTCRLLVLSLYSPCRVLVPALSSLHLFTNNVATGALNG